MASVNTSNITNISRQICSNLGTGLNVGNQPMAAFRIASGQAPGDTAVLQAPNVPLITAVVGPGTDNLATTGATSVTVTLGAVTGTAVTATIGATTWFIYGPLPTS